MRLRLRFSPLLSRVASLLRLSSLALGRRAQVLAVHDHALAVAADHQQVIRGRPRVSRWLIPGWLATALLVERVYGRSEGIDGPERDVQKWPTLTNSCTAMNVEVVLKEPHPIRCVAIATHDYPIRG